MLVGLSHTHHESRIGHIGVNLLDNKTFRALAFVFIRALRVHLLLPVGLSFQVLSITLADISHDVVDGLRDTILTGSRSSHQHVHKRGFVHHIVDIRKTDLPQMSTQRRKDSVSHSRLIDIGGS